MSDHARAVFDAAHARGLMIATAESCTGGMVAAALTDLAGSSAIFDRGFITYSNAAKIEMLDVDPALIETFGAVSEEVAAAMAIGAVAHSRAQIAVSISGIAGPGGSEFKPEGRVCFGVACEWDVVTTETVEFGALGRGLVRLSAREHALTKLLHALGQ
ncbi:damage-inducible protein CinA [Thioclava sp. SK-1]|uniref:CinA family protein n=1 Tax=Thioclava sp. SK-1 TaxID=1889770 RepID=UPI00082670B9|nr:CinA family protein [Thioclava sp. SK-1]OCX63095.1 damage-inducible protein CinA [Thioclava sp. SK-1]